MKLTINNGGKPVTPDETLKTTALLYLEEALQTEQYEDCSEFIRSAKAFGAEDKEIKDVLVSFTRGFKRRPG